jgi:protein-tyrosine phosphatase
MRAILPQPRLLVVTTDHDQDAATGEELLRLASADNFRDVAGPGYATEDGGRVRTGVFFRSNELRLTDEDVSTLGGLGLRAVIDLRSQLEVDRHPDTAIDGADWHHFDVIGIPMEEIAGLQDRDAAEAVMHRVYRSFVESPKSREAFAGVFRQLATGGAQLFHCSAGKDRTGWVAALLLHVAGVDNATIESDYLLTNAFSGGSRARVERKLEEALGREHVAIYEPTLVADVAYLDAAYDAVRTQYGDRATYLRSGLGLDDATLVTLREMLRDRSD